MGFEMKIVNFFHLSNGRIVFVGTVDGHPSLVRSCKCKLMHNSEVRQIINCEGEQIVKKVAPSELRSFATLDQISLTEEEVQSGGWRLICSAD